MTHIAIQLLLIAAIIVAVLLFEIVLLRRRLADERAEVKRLWTACDDIEGLRRQNEALAAVVSQIEELALSELPTDQHICPAVLLDIIQKKEQ